MDSHFRNVINLYVRTLTEENSGFFSHGPMSPLTVRVCLDVSGKLFNEKLCHELKGYVSLMSPPPPYIYRCHL